MTRIIHKIEAKNLSLTKRKKVAAYCRVSSGKDAMIHSLAAQVSHYSQSIQANPLWEYAGVYVDEAVTGTKESRPEFQRLLSDCRAGKVDIILTKSISRFTRNTLTLLQTVRELKALSVEVWFEQERIKTFSGDGEMMLSILGSCFQEESKQVSDNCKWRIRKGFKEGKAYGLNFLYGYTIRKGKMEIEPAQAEVVRLIFDKYLEGTGCRQIASFLNKEDIPSYFNGKWCEDQIARMIRNEKYVGNCLLQKTYVADHLTKKVIINKGQLPMYFAEETHAAIIDFETFQKAGEKMSANRKKYSGGVKPKSHLFTGKITCPYCGRKYTRTTCRGKSAWTCSTYRNFGKDACPSKKIPEDVLLELSASVLTGDEKLEDICEILYDGKGTLTFHLESGKVEIREWKYKSRKDSWTEDMKEIARRRAKTCQGK